MWPVLQEMSAKYGWGANFKESDLEMHLNNNSKVRLVGADMKNIIHRLRGGKYPFVAVDEAQNFGAHLRDLIDEVLTPAVSDYPDGTIALTGTPSPVPKGYFYDAIHNPNSYSVHKWSVYDNPYHPNAQAFVTDLMKRRGWDATNPTYRREWLGEWVSDLQALVYKFHVERNLCYGLPQAKTAWSYVIGVDLGFDPDPSAFVVAAYNLTKPEMYFLEAFKDTQMSVSDVEDKIRHYLSQYPNARVVIDAGGQGKQIVEEIKKRSGISLIPATKQDKHGFIEIMNSDLLLGRIKLVSPNAGALQNEWELLPWGEDKGKKAEEPSMPNHCADAALYAWRYCYHYAWESLADKPHPSTEQAIEQWWDKEAENLQRKQKVPFWEAV
jgi:hypothetical protein